MVFKFVLQSYIFPRYYPNLKKRILKSHRESERKKRNSVQIVMNPH